MWLLLSGTRAQVGPYGNPSEQYEYYTLPFCAPKEVSPLLKWRNIVCVL